MAHKQKEERGCPSFYIQNLCSMMELRYKCVFLVARKPLVARDMEPVAADDFVAAHVTVNE